MNSFRNAIFKVQSLKSLGKSAVWPNVNWRQFQSIAGALPHVQSKRDGIFQKVHHFNNTCTSCGFRQAHTKADEELVVFLAKKIQAWRKAQKTRTIPTEINGFKANLDGTAVTLTKKLDNETVRIKFNVNYSVLKGKTDIDKDQNAGKPELSKLKSKPGFKVEIIRGDLTLSVDCSFAMVDQHEKEKKRENVFQFDEISIYHGEWKPNVYSIFGENRDMVFNNLMLNYLDQKGITNSFVKKFSNYSNASENPAYISLPEVLSKFASNK